MTSERLLVAALLLTAATAHSADMRLFSGAVLIESGLAVPVVEMRSVAENGAVTRVGLSGWTISASREQPLRPGLRWFAAASATPVDANSTARRYRDGERASELEFDSASWHVRAGLRLREGERALTEVAAIAGRNALDGEAPARLAARWQSMWAGLQVTQRWRSITAEDPLLGRISGTEVTAVAETFRGSGGSWTRATLNAAAGGASGRMHAGATTALMMSANADEVSAFLVGGSWDLLGPAALYGTRYAEFRVKRGLLVNGKLDLRVTPSWELSLRGGSLHGSEHAAGVLLGVTGQLRGLRLQIGAGHSRDRLTVAVACSAVLFR